MTKKGAWIFADGKTSYALAEPGGPNVTTTRGPLEVGSVPSGAVLSSGGCQQTSIKDQHKSTNITNH